MNFKTNKINKRFKRIQEKSISKSEKDKESLKGISKEGSTQNTEEKVETFSKFLQFPTFFKKSYFLIPLIFLLLGAGFVFALQQTPAKQLFTKTVLRTLGSDLKQDKNGYINILTIGVGGAEHDGADLTDTILVTSISEKLNKVVLTSIPRDLYTSHENIISQRINSVYENATYRLGEEEGIKTLNEVVQNFTGLPIHYNIKINFDGLQGLVDAVDGVEIYNEETIYDPYYPGPNYSYQTFSLPQGLHTLDGETALKFIRSRKTSSDFARSKRQQQLIFALKDKSLKLGILTSPEALQAIYKTLQKNIQTNLTIREISTLAAIASSINSQDINSIILHDDPNLKGGFLFTPPREQYMNAFVLLPFDSSLSQIHRFIKLHLAFPELMKNQLPIDILNGTKTNGLATYTATVLRRFGFTVSNIENAEDRETTTSYIKTSIGKDQDLVRSVQALFPALNKLEFRDPIIPDPTKDELPSQIQIIIGEDFESVLQKYNISSSIN